MYCYDTTLYYVKVFLILYIYDYGYDAYDYRELRLLRKQHHNLTPASSHFIPHRNLDGIVRTFRKTTYDSKNQKLAKRHNCRNLHISTLNSLLEQKYCISTGLSVWLFNLFWLDKKTNYREEEKNN